MYKRVTIAVSAALFALLAVAASVFANAHDYSYPSQLDTKALLNLNFENSLLADEDAVREPTRLDDRWNLGLLKIAPDLRDAGVAQVYVRIGTSTEALPSRTWRFGDDEPCVIRDSQSLANSYASGQYLVTGSTAQLPELSSWLADRKITAELSVNDARGTASLLIRKGSFAVSLLAAIALMASLVLYWLSVKARGRAIRTLAGVPRPRIQVEDLGILFALITASATVVGASAAVLVGASYGWQFIGFYASKMVVFYGIVIAGTMVAALILSAASWPSSSSLASRAPAVGPLRKVALVLEAATFALVLASVGPAFSAWSTAKDTAAQLAQWRALANQVAVTFSSALSDDEFVATAPSFGEVVREAEQRDSVALSYTWTGDVVEHDVLEPFDAVALVNPSWLRLMTESNSNTQQSSGPTQGLARMDSESVPKSLRDYLAPDLELWERDQSKDVSDQFSYYRFDTSTIPLAAAGGGNLIFPKNALVIVTPTVYKSFNDEFLASIASTRNLTFTGVRETEQLLADYGLQRQTDVKYAAEEGILLAEVAAYDAWLQGVALAALLIALTVAAFVASFTAALLRARRDYPMRLAGLAWSVILAGRVVPEVGVGVLITLAVVSIHWNESTLPIVIITGLVALLIVPLTHAVAARWTFDSVRRRAL